MKSLKKIAAVTCVTTMLFGGYALKSDAAVNTQMKDVTYSSSSKLGAPADKSQWLKHVEQLKNSTIKISANRIVYFDPYSIVKEMHDADIIFITHTHGDHFSIQDIKKVMKSDTTFVVTQDAVETLKKEGFKNTIIAVEPNKQYEVMNIKFNTVPAYNVNKAFHKKESKWVGYIVTIENVKYYIAGDTDIIPEMKDIHADVAFLPCGGTYTMNAKEAAAAANMMKPSYAIPIHFGDVVGTISDAKSFVVNLSGSVEGKILKDTSSLLSNVSVMKQSTIKLAGPKTIYFDPFSVDTEKKDGDIIFITHTHGDHLSFGDIRKVMKSDATLVMTKDAAEAAEKEGFKNIVIVEPNKEYEVLGIKFKTVPAYNVNKEYHPKDNNWVGYVVEMNNGTYYIAGDTDIIPEMASIDADVAFLPVGGTYTMDSKEAAAAASILRPIYAVPIHYGDVVGTVKDADDFIKYLEPGITGVNLKK